MSFLTPSRPSPPEEASRLLSPESVTPPPPEPGMASTTRPRPRASSFPAPEPPKQRRGISFIALLRLAAIFYCTIAFIVSVELDDSYWGSRRYVPLSVFNMLILVWHVVAISLPLLHRFPKIKITVGDSACLSCGGHDDDEDSGEKKKKIWALLAGAMDALWFIGLLPTLIALHPDNALFLFSDICVLIIQVVVAVAPRFSFFRRLALMLRDAEDEYQYQIRLPTEAPMAQQGRGTSTA